MRKQYIKKPHYEHKWKDNGWETYLKNFFQCDFEVGIPIRKLRDDGELLVSIVRMLKREYNDLYKEYERLVDELETNNN